MATVNTYDGTGGGYIETWDHVGDIDLAITERGFTQGSVTLPRSSPHLDGNRIAPNGVGAFVEIDARDEGVPDVCVGYVDTYSADSEGSGDVTVNIVGPATWLDEETVGALQDREGNPWSIMYTALAEHPNNLWLEMGTGRDFGRGQTVRLSGQSIIGLADQLAEDSGAAYRIAAKGGGPMHVFSWGAPVRDRTGYATLYDTGDNANCAWDAAYRFRRQAGEMALAVQSFRRGKSEVTTASMRAPTHTIGVASAVLKMAQDPYLTLVAQSGQTELRPDIRSDQAAVSALRQIASRYIRPDLVARVIVTDTTLWGDVQAGDLVATRWERDPSGWYADAIAYVFDSSYLVPGQAGGEKRLELGVEVYAISSGADTAEVVIAAWRDLMAMQGAWL